jgi:hypothetical protein
VAFAFTTLQHPRSGEIYGVKLDLETGRVIWSFGPLDRKEKEYDEEQIEDLLMNQPDEGEMEEDAAWLQEEVDRSGAWCIAWI